MPIVGRVIDNTRKSDGTIETTVRVDGAAESHAKFKAKRVALRENGYSDVVMSGGEAIPDIEAVEASQTDFGAGFRDSYMVTTKITGAGEYFEL